MSMPISAPVDASSRSVSMCVSRCSHRARRVSFSLLASLALLVSASCERLRCCAVADNGVDEVTTPPDGVADIGRLVTEYCPQENPESSSEESESYSALRALANRALAGVRPVVMRGVVMSPVAKRPVNARAMRRWGRG